MLSFSTVGKALGTVGDMFGQSTPAAGCPQVDPDAFYKRLTAIRVAGMQVIKDEDARGISNELVATVRCNAGVSARQEAKKVIIPIAAIVVVGALVSIAGAVAAGAAARRSSRVARKAASYAGFR